MRQSNRYFYTYKINYNLDWYIGALPLHTDDQAFKKQRHQWNMSDNGIIRARYAAHQHQTKQEQPSSNEI